MGDRTTCTLHLQGVITGQAEYEMLINALRDAGAELDKDANTLPNAGPITSCYTCYDVNYAELDGDLQEVLEGLCLSYAWSWDSGDCYPSGVTLYNAITDFHAEENTCDGSFFVLIEDVDKPDVVEAVKKAQTEETAIIKGPLLLKNSAHDVMAHFAENPGHFTRWMETREEMEAANA